MSRRRAGALLALALLAPVPAGAQAPLSLRFVMPERYTDAENRWGSGLSLRVTLAEVERIVRDLVRRLPPGETLAVEVLDIDLAGFERPGAGTGLRVVTDVSPPRFRLRYTLTRRGRPVLSAQETVSDINFLLRARTLSSASGLAYERELLRGWFEDRILRRQPPPA
ncbi:DUF3016 domain-containing protein [Methylobacterium oryzihabitans]|uniref:DUF3016 domain-containing protein n=1 Tax=Methylobacterium oryzihabitans TaxID=2499852 RepID=A0A437P3J7_9HYPH|nr:DUF3016 domain-containing protein [Methylobacterium oryzihabitans]RVU16823.1 DUF3016 domain-containing protein [Methylobacterium oryzihabitans]